MLPKSSTFQFLLRIKLDQFQPRRFPNLIQPIPQLSSVNAETMVPP
jgi:hypothetical protein